MVSAGAGLPHPYRYWYNTHSHRHNTPRPLIRLAVRIVLPSGPVRKQPAGARQRRAVRVHAQVNKLHSVAPAPKRYCDIETGQDNAALTPGGQGRVLGLHLSFDPADSQR
jgi:hypothetical protein